MWEKFMTKPYVDDNTFRLVGECPTPWPCFVIAVRNEVLENDEDSIKHIVEIINATTREFKDIPSIDTMIANRYGQKLEDVQMWLSLTSWSQSQLTEKEVENIQNQLLKLELIDGKVQTNKLLHDL